MTLVTVHVQEDLRGLMKIVSDPHQRTRELANVMDCDHSTIVRHLLSMYEVKKSGVWGPHALSDNHKNSGWSYLHLCLLIIDWLVNIDHSCPVLLLVEPEQKATPLTKTCAHPQKIILCILWNSEGVLYYELHPRCVTITADIHFQQLRLAEATQEENDQQDCVN